MIFAPYTPREDSEPSGLGSRPVLGATAPWRPLRNHGRVSPYEEPGLPGL